MNADSSATPERLMQLAWSFAAPLIIGAAVNHGVFERLDQGPRSAAQLAAKTGASVRGLTGILNVLVGLELLGRDGDRYTLTAESAAFLVSSRPGYHGMFFRHISDQLLPRWLDLNEIVRTGRPASHVNQEEEGAPFFADFVEALFPVSFSAASALGEHLGIPEAVAPISVLDIGAGRRRLGHRVGETIATDPHPRRGLAARARGHKKGRGPARGGRPINRRSGRVFRG